MSSRPLNTPMVHAYASNGNRKENTFEFRERVRREMSMYTYPGYRPKRCRYSATLTSALRGRARNAFPNGARIPLKKNVRIYEIYIFAKRIFQAVSKMNGINSESSDLTEGFFVCQRSWMANRH